MKLRLVRGLACVLLVGVCGVLAACASQPSDVSKQRPSGAGDLQADDSQVYMNAAYGIRIRYPADFALHEQFRKNAWPGNAWKAFAGPDSPPGQLIAALTLPQSNQVTTGEIRIGASRNRAAVRSCQALPAAALRDSVSTTVIDGVTFATYTARSAGAGHYAIVHSYRAVYRDTCYAMDVLVYGTNPNMYAEPKTEPFTRQQAFARLKPVATGLELIDRTKQAE